MPSSLVGEYAVIRLVTAYYDSWQTHFPQLFKRSQWHAASHLCTEGRRAGVPFAELYGVGGKIFWLDRATMKVRISELRQRRLCVLDPPDAPITNKTMVLPTAALLEQFDRHLLDFARYVLPFARNRSPGRAAGAPHPRPLSLATIDVAQRGAVLDALEAFRRPWRKALHDVLETRSLSPARVFDAKRNLTSTSHTLVLHTVVERYYANAVGIEPQAAISGTGLAAVLHNRTEQSAATTFEHAKDLVELGLLERLPGRTLKVVLDQAAAPFMRAAAAQAASDLAVVARRLAAALPSSQRSPRPATHSPAGHSSQPSEQTGKIVELKPKKSVG